MSQETPKLDAEDASGGRKYLLVRVPRSGGRQITSKTRWHLVRRGLGVNRSSLCGQARRPLGHPMREIQSHDQAIAALNGADPGVCQTCVKVFWDGAVRPPETSQ